MRRPTYSQAVSTLALFISLGGTGYAVTSLPANSVGSAQLRKGAVTAAKLHAGSVGARAVVQNSLTGGQINEATLGTVPSATNAAHAESAVTATSANTAVSATDATNAANATHATSAASADNAALLGGATPDSFRVGCPSGMRETNGLCVEDALRAAADWLSAASICGSAGRHLPSASEVYQSFNVLGAPQTAEWADELVNMGATLDAIDLSEDGNRAVTFEQVDATLTMPFRCVTTATN